MTPPTENIEHIQVKGVTWKQLLTVLFTILGGLMTIEATLLSTFYRQDGRITNAEKNITAHEQSIANLRVDVDVIKQHNAGVDVMIQNLQAQLPKFYGNGKN